MKQMKVSRQSDHNQIISDLSFFLFAPTLLVHSVSLHPSQPRHVTLCLPLTVDAVDKPTFPIFVGYVHDIP